MIIKNKCSLVTKFLLITSLSFIVFSVDGAAKVSDANQNSINISDAVTRKDLEANLSNTTSAKSLGSLSELLEARPTRLALMRCSPPDKKALSNQGKWPICGVIGEVPQLNTEYTDENGIKKDAQKWKFLKVKFDHSSSQNQGSNIVQAFQKWERENRHIRTVEKIDSTKNLLAFETLDRLYKSIGGSTDKLAVSPWDQSKFVFIESEILTIHHSIPLFEANGERIEIANPESGKSPFAPLYYEIPRNYEEYDSEILSEYRNPEPKCQGANRHALLAHEPHNERRSETALFYLLLYLQEQYPKTFGDMHIFQEGQTNNIPISDKVYSIPKNKASSEIYKMLERSKSAWFSYSYSPLNHKHKNIKEAIYTFLDQNNLPTNGYWDEVFQFYSYQDKLGALDTRKALIQDLQSREIDKDISKNNKKRLKQLDLHDLTVSKTLIEDGFRGALAYELFIEGKDSTPSGKSVSVYGLDNSRIYFASCIVFQNCLDTPAVDLNEKFSEQIFWKRIQPYRDWVMAQTVVKKLEIFDKNTVPIILASTHTHLPLVRKFLCDAGIGTTTISDYFKWTPPPIWESIVVKPNVKISNTTPLPAYFPNSPTPFNEPVPNPLRDDPGITPEIETWITDNNFSNDVYQSNLKNLKKDN